MSRNRRGEDSDDPYNFIFDSNGNVVSVAKVEDDGSFDPERIEDDEVYELVGDYVVRTETDDDEVTWTQYSRDTTTGYWVEAEEGDGSYPGTSTGSSSSGQDDDSSDEDDEDLEDEEDTEDDESELGDNFDDDESDDDESDDDESDGDESGDDEPDEEEEEAEDEDSEDDESEQDDDEDDAEDDADDEDYHDFDISADGQVTAAYEVDASGQILEVEDLDDKTYTYLNGQVTVVEAHRGYTETTVFAENAQGLWYEISETYAVNSGGSFSGTDLDDDCDGSDDDDDIAGGSGNDWLRGGHGDDSLHGGRGDDELCLDDGDDVIRGGAGNDWLIVDGDNDATVALNQRGVQDTGYGNDRIIGVHNASGGRGHDRITGNARDNHLEGNSGRDVLNGRAGDDSLSGGNGNDVLNGGRGDDDLSGDSGRDRLRGGGGDDDISGGTGNDRCFGGRGSDMIDGGAGRDIMDAGNDRVVDTFVFTSVDDSTVDARDVIRRFDAGEDKIDLTMIDADGGTDGDQAFVWSEEAAANSVWTEVIGRSTLVSADVDGDGVADMQFILRGTTGITVDDFIL